MKVVGITETGSVLVEMQSEQAYHLSRLIGVSPVAAPAAPDVTPAVPKAAKAEPKQANGVVCAECGKRFASPDPRKRLCSDKCVAERAKRQRAEWYQKHKGKDAQPKVAAIAKSAATGEAKPLTQAETHARIKAALERADAKLGKGAL